MVTPRRADILKLAKERFLGHSITMEDIAITPEAHELKEGGYAHRARISLMQSGATKARAAQRRYADQLASELGLVLVKRKDWLKAAVPSAPKKAGHVFIEKRSRVRIRAIPKLLKPQKKPKILRKSKRKRRKSHTRRVGKVPRALKQQIRNGKRTFRYSADIWKIR